jgi:hypothetical protein
VGWTSWRKGNLDPATFRRHILSYSGPNCKSRKRNIELCFMFTGYLLGLLFGTDDGDSISSETSVSFTQRHFQEGVFAVTVLVSSL